MTTPCRILIVEDDPRDCAFLMRTLLSLGHSAKAEATGTGGLHQHRSGSYDVLIVNYELPGMDGIEFIRRIRLCDTRVGILILTEAPSDEIEMACAGLDVYAVIPKSIDSVCLSEKIESACELAHLSSEKKEQLEGELAREASQVRHLSSFLLNGTDARPSP